MAGKVIIAAATLMLSGAANAWESDGLPVVDLGYQIQRASNFNDTGRFYNFSNIRYAAPPLGNLRFAKPESPAVNRSVIHTGEEENRICPQATPAWSAAATSFVAKQLFGLPTNDTETFVPPTVDWNATIPPVDPRTSEDCLFLDVFAPEKTLKNAGKGPGAPVLVWFYGGGYTAGNKNWNPAGLLAASGELVNNNATGNYTNGNYTSPGNSTGNATDPSIIYVSFNYRTGAFGFLSGPSFQAEGGTSNLAFYDQRKVLEWVQKYIHKFGGDPKRVTVFGESAGGGSIMHQITAYGGSKGPAPFAAAIPQSPGWVPMSSQLEQESAYQQLLDITNSTSLKDLRALSSADIIKANYLQVYSSEYSTFTYGPTVDGDFVPLQPAQLLAQGRFDTSVKVMVGHNAHEGTYFTPPVSTEADIETALRHSIPYIPQSSLDYITKTLYPAVFDGTYPYTSQYERASLLIAEGVFTCNTYYLSEGFDNKTYSYLFSVPPALHGFDVVYTYYDGVSEASTNPLEVTNTTVANALQDFITSFAINGVPQAEGVRAFNLYGPDANVLDLDIDDIDIVTDSNANERCKWWQKALYS